MVLNRFLFRVSLGTKRAVANILYSSFCQNLFCKLLSGVWCTGVSGCVLYYTPYSLKRAQCTSKESSDNSKHILVAKKLILLAELLKKQVFVENRHFWRLKKNFVPQFFPEIKKNCEKLLYQWEVRIKIGKVKKFGVGQCILHQMAADNVEGGFARTPPRMVQG